MSNAQEVLKERSRVRCLLVVSTSTSLGSKGEEGKGTERVLHLSCLYGGVQGVVDMLHHDELSKQIRLVFKPTSHVTNIIKYLEGNNDYRTASIYTCIPYNTRSLSMKTVLPPSSDR